MHDDDEKIHLLSNLRNHALRGGDDRLEFIAFVVLGDFPARNSRRNKTDDSDAHAFDVLDDV